MDWRPQRSRTNCNGNIFKQKSYWQELRIRRQSTKPSQLAATTTWCGRIWSLNINGSSGLKLGVEITNGKLQSFKWICYPLNTGCIPNEKIISIKQQKKGLSCRCSFPRWLLWNDANWQIFRRWYKGGTTHSLKVTIIRAPQKLAQTANDCIIDENKTKLW